MAGPVLLKYEDIPNFLRTNPYIRSGYRVHLPPIKCIKSLFWWTNETLNIWTHIAGCFLFVVLLVYDYFAISNTVAVTLMDKLMLTMLLVCFQSCMLFSACYHLFRCHSEKAYRQWLTLDHVGITISFLAIFVSGIYYAFACKPFWLNFYLITVLGFFLLALGMQAKLNLEKHFLLWLTMLSGWAVYGFVPTVHYALSFETWNHPLVQSFLQRVFVMYLIGGVAFFIYVLKLPEKYVPGKVDYVGSSHQFWHILVVLAFYYWHNTGLEYVTIRAKYGCGQ